LDRLVDWHTNVREERGRRMMYWPSSSSLGDRWADGGMRAERRCGDEVEREEEEEERREDEEEEERVEEEEEEEEEAVSCDVRRGMTSLWTAPVDSFRRRFCGLLDASVG
jgi:hypothetical protein